MFSLSSSLIFSFMNDFTCSEVGYVNFPLLSLQIVGLMNLIKSKIPAIMTMAGILPAKFEMNATNLASEVSS